MKKFLLYPLLVLGVLLLLAASVFYFSMRSQQPQMYAEPVSDMSAPAIAFEQAALSILLFSKTNGFRHHEAIVAAKLMFETMAKQENWFVHYSENAADFSEENLQHFDVVVFSNATQPHFTASQQKAFKQYLLGGGGYVGIHAAGDSSHHEWAWYRDELIRASFTMHPLYPQFQTATLRVENRRHVASKHLPAQMQMYDEWYSFSDNPRDKGSNIVATLDESTYDPNFWAMGEDHPIIWWHSVGQGRMFYSALGHVSQQFSDARYSTLLQHAVMWAANAEVVQK